MPGIFELGARRLCVDSISPASSRESYVAERPWASRMCVIDGASSALEAPIFPAALSKRP